MKEILRCAQNDVLKVKGRMGPVSRFVIICNPTAGRRRAVRLAGRVDELLSQAGYECRVQATSARGDAERIAADAIDGDAGDGELCVVACGGDGTVQQIANAVVRAGSGRAVLGLAPAGRCNDFARALGIVVDPDHITCVLTSGRPKPVDLGRAGDRYFCTVAALGFDAAVSSFVNQMGMPLRGTYAYVYGTLRMLLRYRTPALLLKGDFGEYAGPVFFAASANTPWYGGAMQIAPQADAFDGQVDICLVTRIARLRVLRLLPRVMAGNHLGLPEVRMLRTRSLAVEAIDGTEDIEVWADGEPLGKLPITIEAVPGAVDIMLPAADGRA